MLRICQTEYVRNAIIHRLQNITLSAKLFFSTTAKERKISINPYGHWVLYR